MNEEPTTQQPSDSPLVDAQRNEGQPPDAGSQDPGRRLRELLAVPERERTDAIWDEIIGLEIQLAPGNRAVSPQTEAGRHQEPGQRQQHRGRPGQQTRRPESASGSKPAKRFFKRPKRGPGT